MMLAQPIELYVITPANLLGAFVVGLVVVVFAMALMWWAVRAPRQADDPEATVEIPRPRRGRRQPHTGTVHAAPPSSDETVPISELMSGDRS